MTKPQDSKAGRSLDSQGQAEIEGRTNTAEEAASWDAPMAGPHARPELTNPEATAGTGALPSPTPDDEADAATG